MSTIEKFIGFLCRPYAVIVLLMLYLVFLFAIFPALGKDTAAAPPIDLAFHYTVEEVYDWIERYGEAGRRAYMVGELTLDLIYPLVYTCLFAGLIGLFTRFPDGGKYRWLAISPVLIWIFDLFENIGIVTMLYSYPTQLHGVALVTSWFTTAKWILAYLVIALTLILGCRFIIKKFRHSAA